MNFREIKRKARRDLHRVMRVPALYIATTGATPVPVHVRVHTKFEDVGEISERDVGNASRHEKTPTILFMIDELESHNVEWWKLPRNAVVSVEPGEAYKIDNTFPADDITVSAQVTVMPPRDSKDLPVPGDAQWPISMW